MSAHARFLFARRVPLAIPVLLATAVAGLAPAAARAAVITTFPFVTNASVNPSFPNAGTRGDVRLDSVVVGTTTIPSAQLQVVSGATIVVDNGFDPRGGHILASGRGIDSTLDPWTTEGPATVTPNSADLKNSQSNFNLSSITVTREVLGTAFVNYTFANPTNTFFFWERGGDGDAVIQALDASHNVIGSFKILRTNYTTTAYTISTENGAFNNNGQLLGSIGFQIDTPVSEINVISTQIATGATGGDNGPDYKLIATAGSIAGVPVPEPASLGVLGLAGALFLRRNRRPTHAVK